MTSPRLFVQSIRFRLSVLYSSVVFGLGGAILGVVYYFLRRSLRRLPLVVDSRIIEFNGRPVRLTQVDLDRAQLIEQAFTRQALSNLADYSLVALIVLFLLSLVVGWVIAGRALKPVASITAVARDIQASDLSRRIGFQGPEDELGRLASTFDEMLDRLESAFSTQRRFLANTSHDLRTPLAVIRSNVDVLIDDPGATIEDWREAGSIIQRNAGRMGDMIEDLLAAARLEVRAAVSVDVDLASIVAETAEEVRVRAEERSVSIAANPEPAVVHGVPHSIRRALSNLVDNALKVAPEDSTVAIASGCTEGWGWMAVADEGPGIDPSVTEGRNGRGLGLAIVRQIAEAHRGELAAHAGDHGGTTVVVWIPAGEEAGPVPEHPPFTGGLRGSS